MRVFQQKDAMIWLIDVCDLHRLDASEGRLYEIGLGVRELPEARSGSGRDLIVGRRVPRRRHLEGAPPLRSRKKRSASPSVHILYMYTIVVVYGHFVSCPGACPTACCISRKSRRVTFVANAETVCTNRRPAAAAHAFAARTAYNRRNGESTAHMAIHGR